MNTIVTTHRVINNNIFKIFYIARKRNMDVKITTYNMEYAVVCVKKYNIIEEHLKMYNSILNNKPLQLKCI